MLELRTDIDASTKATMAVMVSQSFVLLLLTVLGFLSQSDDRILIFAFTFLLPSELLIQLWKNGTTSHVRTSMYIWVVLSVTMGLLLPMFPLVFSMQVRLDWMAIILIPVLVVLFYIRKHDFQEDIVIKNSKEISEEYYNGA